MDNMNIVLAANIQKYRKKCGLTQDELAKELGVTFQAVSKWENAKTLLTYCFCRQWQICLDVILMNSFLVKLKQKFTMTIVRNYLGMMMK